MLMELLFKRNKCAHARCALDSEFSYCPDCGELIENQWFITRCSCCGKKQRATIQNGKIVSSENFCENCGNTEFSVERLEKIDFININYAVLLKKIVKQRTHSTFTQAWVEEPSKAKLKLLPQF